MVGEEFFFIPRRLLLSAGLVLSYILSLTIATLVLVLTARSGTSTYALSRYEAYLCMSRIDDMHTFDSTFTRPQAALACPFLSPSDLPAS